MPPTPTSRNGRGRPRPHTRRPHDHAHRPPTRHPALEYLEDRRLLATITEYPIPTPTSGGQSLVTGSDGALWFTENAAGKIGRITTAGAFTEYSLPSSTSGPWGIASDAGPGSALWFTEETGNKIGKISTSGTITEYPLPTGGSRPQEIALGSDGNFWFTENGTNRIGEIKQSTGAITEYTIPTAGSSPWGIAAGPNGALWFTEGAGNKIGRITTAGVFSEFTIPTPASNPQGITAGPDGALWFTEFAGGVSKIGRITTTGAFTEYNIPGGAPSGARGITTGPDGALWFTEYNRGVVARLTTSGAFTQFTPPTSGGQPFGITAGPDGAIWFAENFANQVGRLAVPVSGTVWFSTAGPETTPAGGATWGAGQIEQFGDPGDVFSVNGGTTGGTISLLPGFVAPKPIRGMHYVESTVTIGTTGTKFTLNPGDLVLVLDPGAGTVTLNTGDADPTNDIVVDRQDIVVYRPATPGNYGSGQYFMLLDHGVKNGPTTYNVHALTLVEQDTVVGGTTLSAGTFVVSHSDPTLHMNVYTFTATGTGVGAATQTTDSTVLLLGSALGNSADQVQGLHLLTHDTAFNGTVLTKGTLLMAVKGTDTVAGTPITPFDLVSLNITKTQQDASPGTAATGTLFFRGSDINLGDPSAANLNSLTVVSAAANAPPTVATPASAAPSPVTGNTTTLSVLGADDTGEPGLTYTWSVTAKPAGAADPTYSANSGNAARSTTATFSKSGNYGFTVTITDPGGLSTTSSVSVVVSQTLTSIVVSPATATVSVNQTQAFSAVANDQFGTAMSVQPSFTWAVATGSGSINASGLYTAGGVAGSATITATSGSVTGQSAVTVVGSNNQVTVDTTADTVDGTTTSIAALLANKGPDGRISLREAIQAANNTPGLNQIVFAMPDGDANHYYYRNNGTAGSLSAPVTTTLADASIADFDPDYPYAAHSWFRIDLNPLLPELQITQPLIIEGYSQPGATANTLAVGDNASIRIELTCTAVNGNYLLSNNRGLYVAAGGAGSTIKGLAINRFGYSGILVDVGADGTTVRGNFLGTDVTGTLALGNGDDGIQVRSSNAVIGGSALADRNISSANLNRGLNTFTSVGTAKNLLIQNNYFGVDATGTRPLGNAAAGVVGYNLANSSILGNVISANAGGGIWFRTATATGNTVQGNLIGTDATGTDNLGNQGAGVLINGGANGERIGGTAAGQGNVIAFNNGIGVNVATGTGNGIFGNSIFGNAALGIDLGGNGITANGGAKPAGTPNLQMDFPVFTSATITGTTLNVSGYVGSAPNQALFAGARVEVFTSDNDPSNHGEGPVYLGFLTANASGNFSGSINVSGLSAGTSLTATATDGANNTSEFGLNSVITRASSTTVLSANTNPSVYGQSVTFTATVSGASSTPTGTVTFMDGATVLATAVLSGGTAAFATSSLSAGAHNITAKYAGNSGYLASTSTALTETVTKATLTVTADSPGKVYGAAVPTLTYTDSGLVNGDTSAVFSGVLTTSATASSGVGGYGINQGTLSAGANYSITFGAGTLTVTPAPLSVTADDLGKVYGAAVPTLTYTDSGLVNGDTSAVFSGVLTTSATASSGVGGYGINQGTLSAGANYAITFGAGTLTVTPAPLSVTADDLGKVYGAAVPTLTYTYSGLVNGDTSSVFSGGLATSATAGSHVGGYGVNRGALSAGANYAITFGPGTLTVTPAPLTITADDASKVYGAPNPGFSASYSGFVNGDTSAVVSGLTFGTPATSSSSVGNYPISPGGASASDYTIAYGGGSLTISPASLTVTADSPGKVYGAAVPPLTYTDSGLVNGDTSSVFSGRLTTTATASSGVGGYGVNRGTLSAGANYSITFGAGTLTVTPAPLSVTADDLGKVYGAAVPTLTYTYSGLVNGDTSSVFSGGLATSATAGSHVGGYGVNRGTLSAGANYAITFGPGTLTVTPAPLSVTADDLGKVYGAAVPTLTYTDSGLVNGDTSSVFSGVLTTSATASSGVGGYGINRGALSAGANYSITFGPGTLTVTPAPLSVTADDLGKVYGAAVPTLTYTYSGLVNGDTSSVFSGGLATSATAGSHVGGYGVNRGALSAGANYSITFGPGTLTVTPAPLSVTADDATRPYGRPNPSFSASFVGLVNGDTPASLGGRLEFRTPARADSPAGHYPITPDGLTSDDYAITFVDGMLTVEPGSVEASGSTIDAVEGIEFSGVVATFTTPGSAPIAGRYTAVIRWGDGQTSAGVVAFDTARGVYTVTGANTYQFEGVYAVQVTIQAGGSTVATANGLGAVTDAPLTVTGRGFSATSGREHSGAVATFVDANPSGRPSDFSVTIDWGNGSTSAGTVITNDGGGFLVFGTHTYSFPGAFKVGITVVDKDGSVAGVGVDVRVVAPPTTGGGGTPAGPGGGTAPTGGGPVTVVIGGPTAAPPPISFGPVVDPGLASGPTAPVLGGAPFTPSAGIRGPTSVVPPPPASSGDAAAPAGAPGPPATGAATGAASGPGNGPTPGILQAATELALEGLSRQLDALLGALSRASAGPAVRDSIPVRDGIVTRTVLDAIAPLSNSFWGQLDTLNREVSYGETQRQVAQVFGTGAVAYVGYVFLNGRGGYVLLSLLTSKPLWAQMDPLAVLLDWERDKKRKPGRDEDDDSLQSLIEGNRGPERDEEGIAHDAPESGAHEPDDQPPVRRPRRRPAARPGVRRAQKARDRL